MATSTAANRSVTLVGQNKIFSVICVEIHQHEMGYYYLDHYGQRWQRPTLTALCQDFLRHISGWSEATVEQVADHG